MFELAVCACIFGAGIKAGLHLAVVIAVRVAEEIATIRMLWGGHMIIIRSYSKINY